MELKRGDKLLKIPHSMFETRGFVEIDHVNRFSVTLVNGDLVKFIHIADNDEEVSKEYYTVNTEVFKRHRDRVAKSDLELHKDLVKMLTSKDLRYLKEHYEEVLNEVIKLESRGIKC